MLARGPGRLRSSLEQFLGHHAHSPGELCSDLERFAFLLDGSDAGSSSPMTGNRKRDLWPCSAVAAVVTLIVVWGGVMHPAARTGMRER